MILVEVISLLLTQPSITALVGDRITPVQLPIDSPLPALVLQIVGGQSMQTLTCTGLQKVRVQIDAFGSSYLDAVTLREAVVKFLDGYVGQLTATYLQNAQLIQPIDFFDWQTEQYRSSAEFYLFFNRPA